VHGKLIKVKYFVQIKFLYKHIWNHDMQILLHITHTKKFCFSESKYTEKKFEKMGISKNLVYGDRNVENFTCSICIELIEDETMLKEWV